MQTDARSLAEQLDSSPGPDCRTSQLPDSRNEKILLGIPRGMSAGRIQFVELL